MLLNGNDLYIRDVLLSTSNIPIILPQGYIYKCNTYFEIQHIETVIGIKILTKEGDGTSKAISFYFYHLGSRRTSELDEILFFQLIQLTTLLDGEVAPPQFLPNTEITSLPIDLFNIKHNLEIIPINMQFTSYVSG
ncbi:hypothetical protein ACTFIZ_004655 [Dictyostelium cf. discoideum]